MREIPIQNLEDIIDRFGKFPKPGSQRLFQKADEGTGHWQNRLRKSASDDNRDMKISEKSLKLTIQKFNDPALRAVKRVYTQFWTDTSINQIYEK